MSSDIHRLEDPSAALELFDGWDETTARWARSTWAAR